MIFCNADPGGGQGRRAHELPLGAWHRVPAVSLTGVFRCEEVATVMLAPGRGGKVILTASIYGQVRSANGRSPAYTAAQGGVINPTWELAMEYEMRPRAGLRYTGGGSSLPARC